MPKIFWSRKGHTPPAEMLAALPWLQPSPVPKKGVAKAGPKKAAVAKKKHCEMAQKNPSRDQSSASDAAHREHEFRRRNHARHARSSAGFNPTLLFLWLVPIVHSLPSSRRIPCTALRREAACSAGRSCSAIALRRELTRSSGTCTASTSA